MFFFRIRRSGRYMLRSEGAPKKFAKMRVWGAKPSGEKGTFTEGGGINYKTLKDSATTAESFTVMFFHSLHKIYYYRYVSSSHFLDPKIYVVTCHNSFS